MTNEPVNSAPQTRPWRPAKILAATDFSPSSDRVLEIAPELARHFGAGLYLTHVLAAEQAGHSDAAVDSLPQRRAMAERELSRILGSPAMQGIRHEALLEEGFFWETLDDLIRRYAIDLVIAGTHGHKDLRGEFGGSWAELIFRNADCPVITVGPQAGSHPPRQGAFRHILLANDFGRASRRAVPYACSLAQEFRAALTLLHVIGPTSSETPQERAIRTETARIRLLESLPPGTEQVCAPEFLVMAGDSANEILRFAKSKDVDLIVMGAKSEKLLQSHLPQPATYTVAAAAPCAVMTVRA